MGLVLVADILRDLARLLSIPINMKRVERLDSDEDRDSGKDDLPALCIVLHFLLIMRKKCYR